MFCSAIWVCGTIITEKHRETNRGIKPDFTTFADGMGQGTQSQQSYSSIWNNPSVCMGKKVFLWDIWWAKGIHVENDLYEGGSFMSFEDLKEHFNLTDKGDFCKYCDTEKPSGVDSATSTRIPSTMSVICYATWP